MFCWRPWRVKRYIRVRHARSQAGRINAVLELTARTRLRWLPGRSALREVGVDFSFELNLLRSERGAFCGDIKHVEPGGQDRDTESEQILAECQVERGAEDDRPRKRDADAPAKEECVEVVVLSSPRDRRALAEHDVSGVPRGACVGVPSLTELLLRLLAPPVQDVLVSGLGPGDASAPGSRLNTLVSNSSWAVAPYSPLAGLVRLKDDPAEHDPPGGDC